MSLHELGKPFLCVIARISLLKLVDHIHSVSNKRSQFNVLILQQHRTLSTSPGSELGYVTPVSATECEYEVACSIKRWAYKSRERGWLFVWNGLSTGVQAYSYIYRKFYYSSWCIYHQPYPWFFSITVITPTRSIVRRANETRSDEKQVKISKARRCG